MSTIEPYVEITTADERAEIAARKAAAVKAYARGCPRWREHRHETADVRCSECVKAHQRAAFRGFVPAFG
jgi:hypothetical protein